MSTPEKSPKHTEVGTDRFCPDHARGIRHPAHDWIRHLGDRKKRKVLHHCSGSTLGRYADRDEWVAALNEQGYSTWEQTKQKVAAIRAEQAEENKT